MTLARPRTVLLALLVVALAVLAVPAWAAAAEFTVNSIGDAAKAAPGAVCETATAGECTLRAAIQAASEPGVGTDTIEFDPTVFSGEPTDTIAPATLPEVAAPTTIDGAACNAGTAVPYLSAAGAGGGILLTINAGGSTVENLSLIVPAGAVSLRLNAPGPAEPTVAVLDNTIAMPGTTLPSTGLMTTGANNLIEGNTITSAFGFNYELVLPRRSRSGPSPAPRRRLPAPPRGSAERRPSSKARRKKRTTGNGSRRKSRARKSGKGSRGKGRQGAAGKGSPGTAGQGRRLRRRQSVESGARTSGPAPPSPIAPNVKITAGPKKSSAATTARFRFRATNASGARFECRLDAGKWARCVSPRTLRRPQGGQAHLPRPLGR